MELSRIHLVEPVSSISEKNEFHVLFDMFYSRTMLRDSLTGFGQLDGSNLLPTTSEKCLKQVLHQLMHLHSLWKETLPLSVFRRSIGITINTIVEELVQRIVVLEDIAADAAVQICMHFSILQVKNPILFPTLKVEKILKGSLDLIPSPSSSMKIQIMGGKVCLRWKGKTLLGVVNKLLKTKSLLTSPSNVLPYYLK